MFRKYWETFVTEGLAELLKLGPLSPNMEIQFEN